MTYCCSLLGSLISCTGKCLLDHSHWFTKMWHFLSFSGPHNMLPATTLFPQLYSQRQKGSAFLRCASHSCQPALACDMSPCTILLPPSYVPCFLLPDSHATSLWIVCCPSNTPFYLQCSVPSWLHDL